MRYALALAVVALLSNPAQAAHCRGANGRFIKCPPAITWPDPRGFTVLAHAVPVSACPSLYGADSLITGQGYNVVGYAGWAAPGDYASAGTKDIVILNDATHHGDGNQALWVTASCVTLSP